MPCHAVETHPRFSALRDTASPSGSTSRDIGARRSLIDLPTAESLDFVLGSLPRAARRMLEIGCGDGRLAACMQGAGLEVV